MTKAFQYYEQAFRTQHTNMQHGKPAIFALCFVVCIIIGVIMAIKEGKSEKQNRMMILAMMTMAMILKSI